jgi:hypothetical protein
LFGAKPSEASTSLFGAKPAEASTPLFTFKPAETKPEEKAEPKPLFGGLNTIKSVEAKPATTGNLFGSGSTLWQQPAVGS